MAKRSRKPQPIYRCPRCYAWQRRNGQPRPPACKFCRQTVTSRGNPTDREETNNTAPVAMYATVRVEPEPTEAWGTAWEDL